MKYTRLLLPALVAIAATACTADYQPGQTDNIVVEGWIEDDGFPTVILTQSIGVSDKYQTMDSLTNYMIRWAKVTVSDGEHTVVLAGKFAKGYFPPYIYTTSHLRGQAGKTYTLTVDYHDYHATATTTIPEPTRIKELKVEKCAQTDTLYQMSLRLDDSQQDGYYQIFTRVGRDNRQFIASYLGSINGSAVARGSDIPVFRGRTLGTGRYVPYFCAGDTVAVKLAHIDQTSYNFWSDYCNAVSNGSNLFLAPSSNVRSNISGGQGYWCGMGADTRYLIIK